MKRSVIRAARRSIPDGGTPSFLIVFFATFAMLHVYLHLVGHSFIHPILAAVVLRARNMGVWSPERMLAVCWWLTAVVMAVHGLGRLLGSGNARWARAVGAASLVLAVIASVLPLTWRLPDDDVLLADVERRGGSGLSLALQAELHGARELQGALLREEDPSIRLLVAHTLPDGERESMVEDVLREILAPGGAERVVARGEDAVARVTWACGPRSATEIRAFYRRLRASEQPAEEIREFVRGHLRWLAE